MVSTSIPFLQAALRFQSNAARLLVALPCCQAVPSVPLAAMVLNVEVPASSQAYVERLAAFRWGSGSEPNKALTVVTVVGPKEQEQWDRLVAELGTSVSRMHLPEPSPPLLLNVPPDTELAEANVPAEAETTVSNNAEIKEALYAAENLPPNLAPSPNEFSEDEAVVSPSQPPEPLALTATLPGCPDSHEPTGDCSENPFPPQKDASVPEVVTIRLAQELVGSWSAGPHGCQMSGASFLAAPAHEEVFAVPVADGVGLEPESKRQRTQ